MILKKQENQKLKIQELEKIKRNSKTEINNSNKNNEKKNINKVCKISTTNTLTKKSIEKNIEQAIQDINSLNLKTKKILWEEAKEV